MDLQELGTGATDSESAIAIRIEEEDAARREREYRANNREHLDKDAAYAREWRRKNAEKYAATRKAWREKNLEKLRTQSNDYYALKRERRLAQSKASREKHAEEIKIRRKQDRAKRGPLLNARWREYYAKNPEKLKEKFRKYLPRRRERRKIVRAENPVQRIKDACRTRMGDILRKAGIPKFDRTFDLIGCTPDFFKQHLESQFNRMMNWDNYGTYWEIDHIMPLSKFNLADPEQKLKAFHYSNCQPLEVPLNRSKCNKIITTPPPPSSSLDQSFRACNGVHQAQQTPSL